MLACLLARVDHHVRDHVFIERNERLGCNPAAGIADVHRYAHPILRLSTNIPVAGRWLRDRPCAVDHFPA
ncbi:hypothetical protein D3C76_1532080 [compost metagenome]